MAFDDFEVKRVQAQRMSAGRPNRFDRLQLEILSERIEANGYPVTGFNQGPALQKRSASWITESGATSSASCNSLNSSAASFYRVRISSKTPKPRSLLLNLSLALKKQLPPRRAASKRSMIIKYHRLRVPGSRVCRYPSCSPVGILKILKCHLLTPHDSYAPAVSQ